MQHRAASQQSTAAALVSSSSFENHGLRLRECFPDDFISVTRCVCKAWRPAEMNRRRAADIFSRIWKQKPGLFSHPLLDSIADYLTLRTAASFSHDLSLNILLYLKNNTDATSLTYSKCFLLSGCWCIQIKGLYFRRCKYQQRPSWGPHRGGLTELRISIGLFYRVTQCVHLMIYYFLFV